MATVNFYLKESTSKEATLINLHYHFNRRKFKFSTSEKILPKDWNIETHRARKSFNGHQALNDYIDQLESNLKKIVLDAQTKNIEVTPDYLKDQLLKSISKDDKPIKNLFEYLDEYITIKNGKLSRNYMKKVITLKNTLLEFERNKKFKVTFSRIDLQFYDLFTSFLIGDKKMLNNSVGSMISIMKTFLVWATSRGYNSNLKFKEKEFKSYKQDSDIVYLTESELMHLFNLDLSNNYRLNNVRETFCFSCFTGLRYSDLSKVKKENISNDELKIITAKTKDTITIALNVFAREILTRNNFKLPVISNQKTNNYLKELAELAAIDEPLLITKFRGSERIEIEQPKFQFVSSHTARRTFVTLSLEKGMRAETVMAITGHKNYSTFKKYIKITDKIKRNEMNEVWTRKPQMRIAV